jgi:hypothetical protein
MAYGEDKGEIVEQRVSNHCFDSEDWHIGQCPYAYLAISLHQFGFHSVKWSSEAWIHLKMNNT